MIFREEENYRFFTRKMIKELKGCCDLLAYALMPNHFHFLIYVPLMDQESAMSNAIPVLSRKLGTLQSSYSQAINKRYNRVGALFQAKAKRKLATDYASICFHYIHQNAMKAGLAKDLRGWDYSSFNVFLESNEEGLVNKELAYQLLALPRDPNTFESESYGVINDARLDDLF